MSSYDYLQKQRPASRAGGLSLQSLHAVRVENLPIYSTWHIALGGLFPAHRKPSLANCEEIAALFNTLIGEHTSLVWLCLFDIIC